MRQRVRVFASLLGAAWVLVLSVAPSAMLTHLVLRIAAALFTVLVPLWARDLIEAITKGSRAEAILAAVLLAVSASTVAAMGALVTRHYMSLSERFSVEFDHRITQMLCELPGIEHLERADYADRVHLLTSRRDTLLALPSVLAGNVGLAVQASGAVALLATTDLRLGVLLLAAVAPIVAGAATSRLREREARATATDDRQWADLLQLVTTPAAARELRVFRLEREITDRQHRVATKLTVRRDRAALVTMGLTTASWALFAAAYGSAVAILVVGGASAGDVTLAILLGAEVNAHVAGSAILLRGLLDVLAVLDSYRWLRAHARTNHVAGAKHAATPAHLSDGIDFRSVNFCYPGTADDVLHDVTLRLPAGQTIALVGNNGSGKTTLIKLLAGMYRPTRGSILIDGTPLDEVDLESWRTRIGGSTQDFAQPEFVARDAIGIGDVERIEQPTNVRRAVVSAGAQQVIKDLPAGFGTQLGRSFPGGTELSGGQWQRVALARGLVRPHPLLVLLDEPTAAVDAVAEDELFRRYKTLAASEAHDHGTITLLVSHRFWTARLADLIIVIDTGRVVEKGTHDQLIRLEGFYAEMYRIQARGYI